MSGLRSLERAGVGYLPGIRLLLLLSGEVKICRTLIKSVTPIVNFCPF